ncbi:hypothetical protein HK097_010899, partial [Rhizophlyctis rosea]
YLTTTRQRLPNLRPPVRRSPPGSPIHKIHLPLHHLRRIRRKFLERECVHRSYIKGTDSHL